MSQGIGPNMLVTVSLHEVGTLTALLEGLLPDFLSLGDMPYIGQRLRLSELDAAEQIFGLVRDIEWVYPDPNDAAQVPGAHVKIYLECWQVQASDLTPGLWCPR
jgi:hypothetical protein